ncbi:histidine kinase [Aurantimonas sp. 22II-16-19i]|uniref:histidine kinase n=1 Tax=Aurantimonas sp. 22II-16-19i TaxID=1317114 RepID=UPI0009F7D5ED|nr:histidine kinase [Aurantimonas sp. 22II-16-19i]ORE95188.1 two-component sensor histidine kinase [Aurantimonas sp. 22II-16-19i]
MTATRSPGGFLGRQTSLQARMTAGLLLIGLGAWIALTLVIVVNARIATGREVESSFLIAERFVQERAEALQSSDRIEEDIAALMAQLAEMRHVRATVVFGPRHGGESPRASPEDARDTRGGAPGDEELSAEAADADDPDEEERAPALFASLINSSALHTFVPVTRNDTRLATIDLRSDPSDEIAEVWEDFRFVLPLTMIYGFLVSVVALLYVRRVFLKLKQTSTALIDLKDGNLAARLPEAGFAEFAPVTAGFNELAASLNARTRSNQQLANRLLTAHEEERRRLANDLHDELGPNLFSLRVRLSELKRAMGDEPATNHPARRSLAELESGIADVQMLLRRILSRLKPMSIGSVPLADSLQALVSEYRQTAPEATICLAATTASLSFGEAVDLTVYRFVGEGILNALRHGRASTIAVALRIETDAADGVPVLAVSVSDDGTGPAADTAGGIGLSAVRDRVETLGGSLCEPARRDGTTVVAIRIPTVAGKPARMTSVTERTPA